MFTGIRTSFMWALVGFAVAIAAPAGAQTLDIYFIDTEGGQATLYVSPSGETMMVDTGNPGERDHARIREVMQIAGVSRIDHQIITHYHGDHHGGVELLSQNVPIGRFYDHGTSVEAGRANVDAFMTRYAEIAGSRRTIVKPGDRIPFAGVDVLVVASHGDLIQAPLQGVRGVGAPNPACASFQPLDMSTIFDPDNDSSVGTVITFGQFRTINLGDLTKNWERDLMCPNNKIGEVDLYLTSHHGLSRSGSAVLVHALRPRVAIMNNGTRKGGDAEALRVLHSSPGLEDLWQLHWSYHGRAEENAPGMFIANLDEPAILASIINPAPAAQGGAAGPGGPPAGGPPAGGPPAGAAGPAGPGGPPAGPGAPGGAAPGGPAGPGGPGGGFGGGGGGGGTPAAHTPAHYIKVSARADGSFTVTNSRNGFSKTYEARQ